MRKIDQAKWVKIKAAKAKAAASHGASSNSTKTLREDIDAIMEWLGIAEPAKVSAIAVEEPVRGNGKDK